MAVLQDHMQPRRKKDMQAAAVLQAAQIRKQRACSRHGSHDDRAQHTALRQLERDAEKAAQRRAQIVREYSRHRFDCRRNVSLNG